MALTLLSATAPLRGAQAVDADVRRLFIYAGILLGLILLMIIVKIVMKVYTAGKVSGMRTPFGVSPEDLEKMRSEGRLTPEEARKVRAAMARQLLERQKAEEEARRLPPKAEVILSRAEAELREGRKPPPAEQEDREAPKEPPPTPAGNGGSPEAGPDIPPRLRVHLDRSDVELEQLVEAGFLDRDDYLLLLQERRRKEARNG